ncbi:MAG TPA: hypothetical protein VGD52_03755 [Pseudoduganella sp.]
MENRIMNNDQIKAEIELVVELEIIELNGDETISVAGGPEVDNDPRNPP